MALYMSGRIMSWNCIFETVQQRPAKLKMYPCFEGNLSATKYSANNFSKFCKIRVHLLPYVSFSAKTGNSPQWWGRELNKSYDDRKKKHSLVH